MNLSALQIVTMLAGLAPAAAVGQVQSYYHVGAWDAFSGRSESGGPVCGMSNTNSERRLAIEFDIGSPNTVFSASKADWSVPDNLRVTLVMQIGLNAPWTQQGTGHEHTIDWTLDGGAMQVFDRQFRGASSMTLTFPDGSEPPWSVSLAGSTAISDTFARCVRDLTRQAQSAAPALNQAPPSGGATQPFGAAPAAPAAR